MRKIVVSEAEAGRRLDRYIMKYFAKAPKSFIYKAFRKKNIKLSGRKADGSEIIKAGDEIWLFFSDERISELTGGAEKLSCGKTSAGAVGRIYSDSSVREVVVPHTDSSVREVIVPCTDSFGLDIGLGADKSIIESELQRYCSIVYEDRYVILADKASGVLTQKAAAGDRSLNEVLLDYCRSKYGSSGSFTPSVCNRLDRNTSGLVIFAAAYSAARVFSEMLRTRAIKKYYIAAVWGRPEGPVHDRAFLTKDKSINRVTIEHTKKSGTLTEQSVIETAFWPLEESDARNAGIVSCFGSLCGRQYTLVKVELITGKSHQIRAHLAFLGYPLIGDAKYGDVDTARRLKKEYGIDSQLLHAWEIVMPERISEPFKYLEARTFRTALPGKFSRLVQPRMTQ